MLRRVLLLVCSVALIDNRSALAGSATVVEDADAFVTHDSDAGWVIGNARLQVRISAPIGAEFRVLAIVNPQVNQDDSVISGVPLLTIDGKRRPMVGESDGFRVSAVAGSNVPNGVQLDVETVLIHPPLHVTVHYVVYNASPTVEMWTTVRSAADDAHWLADLNAFNITMPAGTARWLDGLQEDDDDAADEAPFTLEERNLADGELLRLGAVGRSSEQSVPWIVVNSGNQSFFAGLMWSGAWAIEVARTGRTMAVTGGLAPMSTLLRRGATVEGPHGFLGIVAGDTSQIAKALQAFVVTGLRGGRPFQPLMTFNTWYSRGVQYNESDVLADLNAAARFGAELFVLDAGWYQRPGTAAHATDFEPGLGNWHADPTRFPSGLRALSDYAHRLGMKFGLWVEPERIALESLRQSGPVQETWLATADGEYKAPTTAQICLAGPAAREWVFSQVSELIDRVQPDYLKWDNNFWINCTRNGHQHGQADGNYAHVNGLYDLLARLRARYPTLLIENCSGGGRRLDLGMMRYTDVAWMDDRSAPSMHVRHNVEGLSTLFPPAYLLSFVVDDPKEGLHHAPDLTLQLRSRMQGVFGFSAAVDQFTGREVESITHEIALYKKFRDKIGMASATLLTAQAGANSESGWDVLQLVQSSVRDAIICAFELNSATSKINVRPRDLDPGSTYDVDSVDVGRLGTATGAELMANGIDLFKSTTSAAHIVLITAHARDLPSAKP